MSAVKPLTVVTKVGILLHPDRPLSWVHEDCVTLADAERYARENAELAVVQACRNLEIRNEKLDALVGRLRRELTSVRPFPSVGDIRIRIPDHD